MAFHSPGTEPSGNKRSYGPLRLLLSDQRAAQLPRSLVVAAAKLVLIALGLSAVLLQLLSGATGGALGAIASHQTPDAMRIDYAALSVATVIASGLLGFAGFVRYLIRKWRAHLTPQPFELKRFFWVSDAEGNSETEAGGVLFDRKRGRWFAHPVRSQVEGLRRGFNLTGMTLGDFLRMEATVGVEYPLRAFGQIVQHYCGSRKWNSPGPDRKSFYKGVINSSLAPYLCTDKQDANYGDIVLTNQALPFAQHASRTYSRMIIHLDHEDWEVSKLTLEYQETPGRTTTEIWGSADSNENTYQNLSADEQVLAVGQMCLITVALSTHTHIHWWANATSTIPNDVWRPASSSTEITQWMNSQAVLLSWWFVGSTLENIGSLLVHNAACGMPMHGKDAMMSLVAERSELHQMVTSARKRVAALIKERHGDTASATYTECVIAATLMHSGDHYFASKYFPKDGNVIPLQTDASGLFLSLCGPIRYRSRRLLVRDYLDDPISAILCEEAEKIDAEFARKALSIGCAY